MPYVTIPAISRTNLLNSAERRWRGIRETRSDLEPALVLQRGLLTLVIDLAARQYTNRDFGIMSP